MTDIYDRATEVEQLERDRLLERRHQVSRNKIVFMRFGVEQECRDCGDPIPRDRQAASLGCTRCRECEARHERLQKLQPR